mgnify:CR=1 FL=1
MANKVLLTSPASPLSPHCFPSHPLGTPSESRCIPCRRRSIISQLHHHQKSVRKYSETLWKVAMCRNRGGTSSGLPRASAGCSDEQGSDSQNAAPASAQEYPPASTAVIPSAFRPNQPPPQFSFSFSYEVSFSLGEVPFTTSPPYKAADRLCRLSVPRLLNAGRMVYSDKGRNA